MLTGKWTYRSYLNDPVLVGDKAPAALAIIFGTRIAGTATAGWRYDYHGGSGYAWPDGLDQVASLPGTVLRVNAHGPHSPAGVTASFMAVRPSEEPVPKASESPPHKTGQ